MSYLRAWHKLKREQELEELRDSDSIEDLPGEDASDCEYTPQTQSRFSSDHMPRSQSISNSDGAPEPLVWSDFDTDMEYGSTDSETEQHDEGHGSVSLEEDLRKWTVHNKTTRRSLNELLQILRKQGHLLPIDARTLLGTPQPNTTEDKCGDQYAYYGLEKGFRRFLGQAEANAVNSIDGIPLFKSRGVQHSLSPGPRKTQHPSHRSRSRSRSPLRAAAQGVAHRKSSSPQSVDGRLQHCASDIGDVTSQRQAFPLPAEVFQRKVLNLLIDIRSEVRQMGQGTMASSATSARVERMETIEEFRREEHRLADTEAFDALVLQLTRIGGRDTRDCVHKVLDSLLTNGLMAQFNLKGKGKGDKVAFENTLCYRAVLDAVIRAQPHATEVAIRQCIGDHLKHAPARRGGRWT